MNIVINATYKGQKMEVILKKWSVKKQDKVLILKSQDINSQLEKIIIYFDEKEQYLN